VTVTDYLYDGLKLISVTTTKGPGNELLNGIYANESSVKNLETLDPAVTSVSRWQVTYYYDAAGNPYAGLDRKLTGTSRTTHSFFIVSDNRGDVLELLDADHVAFAAYRYDVYGRPTATVTKGTPAIDSSWAAAIAERNLLRYSGYVYDAHSGLYYLQRRYYDPITRAFLARDPLRADADESPYQYCSGNPVALVDPEGLAGHGPGGACISPKMALSAPDPAPSSGTKTGTTSGSGTGNSSGTVNLNTPSPAPKSRCHLDPSLHSSGFTGLDEFNRTLAAIADYLTYGPVLGDWLRDGGREDHPNVALGLDFAAIWMPDPSGEAKFLGGAYDAYRANKLARAARAADKADDAADAGRKAWNLVDDEAARHILYGDGPGSGGHMWPGAPGKSAFPMAWDADRILYNASDVATDPLSIRSVGNHGNIVRTGVRDGVTIRVVLNPKEGMRIVSAYPAKANYWKVPPP
jgi:RHS repeat-associated protein